VLASVHEHLINVEVLVFVFQLCEWVFFLNTVYNHKYYILYLDVSSFDFERKSHDKNENITSSSGISYSRPATDVISTASRLR